jgi:lipooligosaccharide transport system ATP-binding protein
MIATGTPRELVERHIEPQVVEVFGDGAEAWSQAQGARLAERCETAGETVFCYVHDATALIADLAARAQLRYVHRPANLEDVFLRLTGRDLRD